MKPGDLRIGTSGWRYRPWRGAFYPKGLAQKRELAFLAEQLTSVEVNGSFYSLLRPETYARWAAETPPSFVFALKGSRYITHMLRLGRVDAALANFFASGVLALGARLGPILWQLPERFLFDEARIAAFFERLPRTHARAAALAKGHDARLEGRALVRARHRGPIRHVIEPRHPSFEAAAFRRLCARHDVAIAIADSAGHFPRFEHPEVASFVYARLHGAEELYASGYTPPELDAWAALLRPCVLRGQDAYVYFDNDTRGHAPFDALALDARFHPRDVPERPRAADALAEAPRVEWPAWKRTERSPRTATRRTTGAREATTRLAGDDSRRR